MHLGLARPLLPTWRALDPGEKSHAGVHTPIGRASVLNVALRACKKIPARSEGAFGRVWKGAGVPIAGSEASST